MEERITNWGPSSLHDATVQGYTRNDDVLEVTVLPFRGPALRLRFSGVEAVDAVDAVGMMLYAVTEQAGPDRTRVFTFVNWDDDAAARLKVIASTATVAAVP